MLELQIYLVHVSARMYNSSHLKFFRTFHVKDMLTVRNADYSDAILFVDYHLGKENLTCEHLLTSVKSSTVS